MAKTENNLSAKDLRKYVKKHFPKYKVITRKASNTHALIYHGESGEILEKSGGKGEMGSNFKLKKKLEKRVGLAASSLKRRPQFFSEEEVPSEFDRKTVLQKNVEQAIGYLTEIQELTETELGEPGEVEIVYTDEGYISKLKINGITLTPNKID